MRRHYHPAPPARTVKQERTFEGISLDQPGASSRQVPFALPNPIPNAVMTV